MRAATEVEQAALEARQEQEERPAQQPGDSTVASTRVLTVGAGQLDPADSMAVPTLVWMVREMALASKDRKSVV